MDKMVIALSVAALIVGILLLIFISRVPQKKLDKELYQSIWRSIRHSASASNSDSLQMAIVKADKLLDKALQDYGAPGSTIGERLKSRKGLWTHENAVWSAHKLRNQIAHEQSVEIDEKTFKWAMNGFETALKDLGAL